MTPLVESALREAGLMTVWLARRAADERALDGARGRLLAADLLALGALADEVRKEEVGDAVRVFANVVPDDAPEVVHVARDGLLPGQGLAMLRETAIARITGPRRARVRIDWAVTGLELAQVALGFGANELVGPIASKRGLPIAMDAEKKVKGQGNVSVQLLKKRELSALVERSGRRPIFAGDAADPVGVVGDGALNFATHDEAPHVG